MGSRIEDDFLDSAGIPKVLSKLFYQDQFFQGMEVYAPHAGVISWLEDSKGRIADKGSAMCKIRYYKHDTVIESHIMGFCKREVEEGSVVQKGEKIFQIKF